MPFTPYHFGPSGFVGLSLRKYIDVPVFVLANVAVDIEVVAINVLSLGSPVHRYAHTLLLGAVVGIIWGLIAYATKPFFKRVMQLIRVPYKASLPKMIVSGILGVWLHVALDAVYHYDVRLFWPGNARPLFGLLSRGNIKLICLGCFVAAICPYLLAVKAYLKNNKAGKTA